MFTHKKLTFLIALLAGILFLSACGSAAEKTPTVNPNDLLTQAAKTVAVQLTEISARSPAPAATATTAPTNTQRAAPTVALPTPPPAATSTPVPQGGATAQPQTGDAASFVADVTVPDGTGAAPGVQFVKTWRIKNTGKTTWTTSYGLAWIEGEKMGAPDFIPMPNEVRPDETVDISVKLTAPQKGGSYQTFFRLRNAAGQYFRLDGSGDLWVKIAVGGSSPTPDLTMTAEATPETPTVTPTK